MNGEERLRAAFEQAERSLPPLRPNRDATLERGRRLLRKRALATLASGAVLFSGLVGGGILARAATQDGEAPETMGDERNGGGDTTDAREGRPDLVPTLTPTAGGVVLVVENRGDADAGPFVVAAVNPGSEEPAAPEQRFSALPSGARDVRELACQESVEARVDAEQQVAESVEQNNVDTADCEPPNTTQTAPQSETSPQTTETSPQSPD